ncbi:substrate binding domain-containing protein, partial [Streptomyces sp. S9]|nr:substrate binding domain-containing protein [Streptomyces sp. S9]
RFLQHAREALRAIDEGEQALRGEQAVLRGSLQLSMPSDLGRSLVLPWLDGFLAAHPQVQLRANLSDHFADVLVAAGMDLAIRIGALGDSSLVARKLADNRRVLACSPDYLRQHTAPRVPQDLAEHECLVLVG